MIIPATDNLKIQQGSTFERTWEFPDSFNLGYYNKAKMQIRTRYGDQKVQWDSTTVSGSLVITGQQLKLKINADDTALLTFTDGKFDIDLIKDTVLPRVVDTYFKGDVTVDKEITK